MTQEQRVRQAMRDEQNRRRQEHIDLALLSLAVCERIIAGEGKIPVPLARNLKAECEKVLR